MYRLLTSKEMILSSESDLVFSIISLAGSMLVSIFAPSIYPENLLVFYSVSHKNYRGERGRVGVLYAFYVLYPVHKIVQVDLNLAYKPSVISSLLFCQLFFVKFFFSIF